MNKAKNVDEYLAGFPDYVREKLKQMRETIRKAAPDAQESISYGMPAYKTQGKPLVYFAGHSNHIGFYALPSGHKEFEKELSGYKQGKGSVQFPLDQKIPLDLVKRIVKFRVEENLNKK